MNREERLRRELPADLKHRATELAGLPVAQVDLIVAALKASHREGRATETEARRRRREGRPCDRIGALDRLAARTAARPSLDDLADLAHHYENAHGVLQAVVNELRRTRPEPFSWADIGAALGCTKQAAWERFGRQGDLDGQVPRD